VTIYASQITAVHPQLSPRCVQWRGICRSKTSGKPILTICPMSRATSSTRSVIIIKSLVPRISWACCATCTLTAPSSPKLELLGREHTNCTLWPQRTVDPKLRPPRKLSFWTFCTANGEYTVRLSAEERGVCQEIVKRLKGTSEKVKRAQVLLKADADGPEWSDIKIAEAYDCRLKTVETVRKRLVTEGCEVALERKKRSTAPTPHKLDGIAEAKLIAMRLGKPPAGYGRWSLQLLADRLVAC